MANEYTKLYVSEVFPVSSETGIRVEVAKGPRNCALSIWTMYRTEDGEWGYTSTRLGARNIRMVLDVGVAEFLLGELQKVRELAVKLAEKSSSAAKKAPKKEPAPGELPNLDDPSVLALLANFLTRAAGKEKSASKKSTRK